MCSSDLNNPEPGSKDQVDPGSGIRIHADGGAVYHSLGSSFDVWAAINPLTSCFLAYRL